MSSDSYHRYKGERLWVELPDLPREGLTKVYGTSGYGVCIGVEDGSGRVTRRAEQRIAEEQAAGRRAYLITTQP